MSKTYRLESPTYHIGITGLLSRKAFSYLIKKEGLTVTPEQIGVLNLLVEKGIISMQALSQFSLRDNSAITRIVDNLEKNNFVQRKRHKSDRRKIQIEITDTGKEVLIQANKIGESYVKSVTTDISSREINQMISVLTKIKNNIEKIL